MADYEYDLAKLSSPSAHSRHDARHIIEVKETPGKGLGIFARENILQGTRIVAERPLLKARIVSSHGVDVQTSFNSLPPNKQRAYLDLYGFASETLKKDNNWDSLPALTRQVLAIYAANRWGRDVFWLASRFNHSCIPNIHNAYNPTIEMETFHSIRDIEAGEELTISYLYGTPVRNDRREQLSKWGFQCKCPACEDVSDGNEIEEKLVQIATLTQRLKISVSWKEKLDAHQKMAALMRSIGLIGKSLHQCYLDAAFCSAVLGNVKMTVLWAEKEVAINGHCVGRDHPDYKKEMVVLNQLQRAAKSKRVFHYTHIDWISDWDQGPE